MTWLNTFKMISFLLSMIAFILALSFHEFCHAAAAYFLGDDTAKRAGRLTLNPLSHIDPLGILCLIFLRIGWARPVPFNPYNFRFPRLGAIFVGLCGPFSNLVLAFLGLLIEHTANLSALPLKWSLGILLFLSIFVNLNIMLALFNLIPIPPLDGGHIIMSLLPERYYHYYGAILRFSFILLIIIILLPGFEPFFFKAISLTQDALNSLVLKITGAV